MTIPEAKRQARLEEWHGRIEEQQRSGLTVKDWCEQSGCGEGQFYYWLKLVRMETINRYETGSQGLTLVRVEPTQLRSGTRESVSTAASQALGIVIRYGRATVEMPAGTQCGAIAELVKALGDS